MPLTIDLEDLDFDLDAKVSVWSDLAPRLYAQAAAAQCALPMRGRETTFLIYAHDVVGRSSRLIGKAELEIKYCVT